jgi:hypothetical protein
MESLSGRSPRARRVRLTSPINVRASSGVDVALNVLVVPACD